MSDNKRAWMVRITDREKLCEQHSMIAIGWSRATSLRDMPRRAAIKAHVYEHYTWYNNRGLGSVAGTILRFVHQIQPGDLIAVVSGHRAGFRIAEVQHGQPDSGLADYRVELVEHDSAWSRPVRYLTGWLSRSQYLPGHVQAALKGQQTCLEKTQYLVDFERVATNQTPLNDLSDELSDALSDDMLETLRSHLSDRQLESLVCDLAKRSGATTAQSPKGRLRAPGDVDVEATYTMQYGAGEKTPRVWYQVKQHRGATNSHAVRQLIDRSEADTTAENVEAMVVVSTADRFSGKAVNLAEASGVELMNGRDLVEWILKTGLGAPSRH